MRLTLSDKEIMEGVEYVGEIVVWDYDDENGRLSIDVNLDDFPNDTFKRVLYFKSYKNSAFYYFCKRMKLINKNNEVVLNRLNKNEKICITLNQMDGGGFMVNEMCWLSDFIDKK